MFCRLIEQLERSELGEEIDSDLIIKVGVKNPINQLIPSVALANIIYPDQMLQNTGLGAGVAQWLAC